MLAVSALVLFASFSQSKTRPSLQEKIRELSAILKKANEVAVMCRNCDDVCRIETVISSGVHVKSDDEIEVLVNDDAHEIASVFTKKNGEFYSLASQIGFSTDNFPVVVTEESCAALKSVDVRKVSVPSKNTYVGEYGGADVYVLRSSNRKVNGKSVKVVWLKYAIRKPKNTVGEHVYESFVDCEQQTTAVAQEITYSTKGKVLDSDSKADYELQFEGIIPGTAIDNIYSSLCIEDR